MIFIGHHQQEVELVLNKSWFRALPWPSFPGLALCSAFQQHITQQRVKERFVEQQPYRSRNLFSFIGSNGFTSSVSQLLPGYVAVTTKPQVSLTFNSKDSFFPSLVLHLSCKLAMGGPDGLFLLKSRLKQPFDKDMQLKWQRGNTARGESCNGSKNFHSIIVSIISSHIPFAKARHTAIGMNV